MTELTIFNYQEQEVRTITDEEGNPWFVAKDVCNVLEIKNSGDAVSRLKNSQKDIGKTDTLGGIQNMSIINEAGVYRLIMRSNKPEAEQFQDWIAEDVLPSIRKTGSYSIDKPKTEIEWIEYSLKLAKEKEQLLLESTENKPKVEYYEKVSDATNYHGLGDTAKILGWGRNKFIKDLRDTNVFMKSNTPYQRYIDAGYFVVKERTYGGDLGFLSKTTYVTGKGIQWLFKRYEVGENE